MVFRFAVILACVCIAVTLLSVSGFQVTSPSASACVGLRGKHMHLNMEYIPEGLSNTQWAAIKKKEADSLKKKGNLGALGTTKFKSRSFEAWQKAGGKHLFPVDPRTTPYEERPYMQRKNGDWEGGDLSKKGYKGKEGSQGEAGKRLRIDGVYDKAKKDGKLDSANIFGSGMSLPWTSKQAQQITKGPTMEEVQSKVKRGVAGRQRSPAEIAAMKAKLEKPVFKETNRKLTEKSASGTDDKPKKRFGFF